MAIDWTPLAPDPGMYTGIIEYRVENDGLVRWRGTVNALIGYANITIPAAARPKLDEPIYDFRLTGLILYGGAGVMYLGYNVAPLSGVVLNDIVWIGNAPPSNPHTLAGMRAGITEALQAIDKLRVHDFPSNRIEPPAAVLSLPETPYDVTLGGRTDNWEFPLWVLVAKADDKSSYGEMNDYMEASGSRSILAAIEADRTLGGACDTVAVTRARPMFATVAGTEFLAVEFTLEAFT